VLVALPVVLAPAEEGDVARFDETAVEDVVEVCLDLRLPSAFVETVLRSARLDGCRPSRVDATR